MRRLQPGAQPQCSATVKLEATSSFVESNVLSRSPPNTLIWVLAWRSASHFWDFGLGLTSALENPCVHPDRSSETVVKREPRAPNHRGDAGGAPWALKMKHCSGPAAPAKQRGRKP